MDKLHAAALVAVIAAVTIALRFAPFLLLRGRETPKFIAYLGRVLPFSTEGIDFSLTALFVTVFVDQWRTTKDHIPALVGLAASLGALALFGSDNFLIPAMLLITAALALYRRKEAAHG